MPTPQFFLRDAEDAFDRSGRLRDEQANVRLTNFLAAFRQWIEAAPAQNRNGADHEPAAFCEAIATGACSRIPLRAAWRLK